MLAADQPRRPGFPVRHPQSIPRAGDGKAERGRTARHRFEKCNAKAFAGRWHHKKIRRTIDIDQALVSSPPKNERGCSPPIDRRVPARRGRSAPSPRPDRSRHSHARSIGESLRSTGRDLCIAHRQPFGPRSKHEFAASPQASRSAAASPGGEVCTHSVGQHKNALRRDCRPIENTRAGVRDTHRMRSAASDRAARVTEAGRCQASIPCICTINFGAFEPCDRGRQWRDERWPQKRHRSVETSPHAALQAYLSVPARDTAASCRMRTGGRGASTAA